MASNSTMIHKLQTAINQNGGKILYQTTQFFSEDQNRPITMYLVKEAIYNEEKGKNENITLFKSTSQIQIVLYLRDYWYKMNGQEPPDDNEEWNKVKEKLENG